VHPHLVFHFTNDGLTCSREATTGQNRLSKEKVAKDEGCGSFTRLTTMNKPKIIAYLKPQCGWSNGVRAVMRKYDLPYEDRDIINDPAQRQEMIQKSGQMLSPCVEIDGRILADISGEEVEAYMLSKNLVSPTARPADAPTNAPCDSHEPEPAPLQFRR
jgi:monothiol glutaredoxin